MATTTEIQTCPTCKGAGKVTLTVTDEHQHVTQMPMDCVICGGTGRVTQAEVDAVKRFQDSWCRCPDGGAEPYYVADGKHAHCKKHHWDCSRCGGLVQIG